MEKRLEMTNDRDFYSDENDRLKQRITSGTFNSTHICLYCMRRFDEHAGPKNPDCPSQRCPGSRFPSFEGVRKEAVDAALKSYWNERQTIFYPK